ncbi:MAG: phasin family protein [Macromonas bipunctata]|jgi:phasin family protein|uniref:phasin family protein n=1 Tax=Macromonas bipunctata TaxID=183670 RepID=UPI000C320731|nr:phasin family protein [Macromonas bipunctata]MDD2534998.1 phasin family protein [Macromonas bipunctata]
MMTVDHIVAAQKAQIATVFELSSKALASVEKIVELNLQATKAALADSASSAQSLLNIKDVQELLALQTNVLQPLADKAAAYSRHLYEIASGAAAEFSKAAEAQAADAQKQFTSVVDNAVKNAPQGSESAVAAVKNAISTASTAMESMQKVVKQATEMAEANLQAVTTSAVNTAKSAAKTRA